MVSGPAGGYDGSAVSPMTVYTSAGGPVLCVAEGTGPTIAVALHAGHDIRGSLLSHVALPEDDRLREEDPYTDRFAPAGVTRVEVLRSRFEVDLNRSRDRAIYGGPEDAWGLDVWATPLTEALAEESLSVYDAAYAVLAQVIDRTLESHPSALVLDLHSYNHRRQGPDGEPDDPELSPEINLGTRRIDRERWAGVVAEFSESMRGAGFDVRENVKFGGGHFARWVDERYGPRVCVLSIEFKKTFMDEWTGGVDLASIERARRALTSALPRLEQVLARIV